MKIVVTGSNGFLGSRIVEYYSREHEVFAPGHGEMNITDKEAVKEYLESVRPDIIVHCAAVSDVGTCGREPERSWAINVTGSENIAEIGGNLGAKCILCSSDQVYVGSSVMMPHLEDEEVVPQNEYGRQKLTMEQRCLLKNPDSVLLRLSWMYDVKKRNEQEHGNFMTMLLDDLENCRELYFSSYDMRGLTDVAEVVKNLEKTFTIPGGVYNYGSYNDTNLYETMKEVAEDCEAVDLSRIHEEKEDCVDKPRNISMNVDKIGKFGITFSATAEGIVRRLKNRKHYKTILFDLDGTLTDPGEGITNSVWYALKKYNISVKEREELYCFIGPPLLDSFEQYYGFSKEQAREAMGYYREYFKQGGMFENEVYDGVEDMLKQLKDAGKTLIVATSKPEVFARQILEYFHLDQYFTFIAGASLDETRVKKADVIAYALKSCKIADLSKVLMVGDREHDVIGAKTVGIDCMGVLFGYGSREELEQAGADYIAEKVEDIRRNIL